MRKKSIAAFVSIYAALCIAYGVVGNAAVSDRPDTEDIISTTSVVSVTESSSGQKKSAVSENSFTESSDNEPQTEISLTVTDESADSVESYSDDPYAEESVISEYEENEIIFAPEESEDESQEQIDDEDEYEEEKPSLQEFLRGLRCSGCRHNCSLLSPRCMNGARKASQAETQYYQTYGT